MKYYKRSHRWPHGYLLALALGGICLGAAAFAREDLSIRFELLVCGVFALIVAVTLWKSRRHYLEIDGEWIIHHGFQRWRLRKADLLRVEHGRKGWADDNEPFLTVHARGREYPVDGGFLVSEERIEELIRSMHGLGESPRT